MHDRRQCQNGVPIPFLEQWWGLSVIVLVPKPISHDNRGLLGGAAASLSDNALEACELWSAKPCCCIPTFCALPTRSRIFSDRVGTLGDVVEGIGVLVEKGVDKAKSLATTRSRKAFLVQERVIAPHDGVEADVPPTATFSRPPKGPLV